MSKIEKDELQIKFIELYEKGNKDSEIARLLNVNETKINVLRNKLNLPPNGRVIIKDEVFIELFNKGLTLAEICKQTGISSAAASRRAKKLNLDYKKSKNVKLNYVEIDENKFIELYNQRKTDAELSKIFECSETKIKVFRDSLNLPIVDRKHFTNEEFLKYYNLNYTDIQLSEVFNVSSGYVTSRRNKLNLPPNKLITPIIPLTDTEFQVILGTTLGDTHLRKANEGGNVSGSCAHCLKQEEFIFSKYNYLKNISKEPYLQKMHDERFFNPSYERWVWYINSNPALNEIYEKMYKDKIKFIDEELFRKIEPLGLAIWFMDDGANAKYGYVICTHSFSLKDLSIIQKVLLEKFDIHTTVRKCKSLYITAKSKIKFKNLIQPFIIESMLYKLI